MNAGRTSWWPCDSAEHDREVSVELGEEFGPAGPYTLRVLKDLAQQQRDDGRVRTGFRSLRRKVFVDTDAEVRKIVEYAGRVGGGLDELVIDDDGRRFSCRISGWEADQTRGRAAIKKAAARAEQTGPERPVPPEGDMSPEPRPDRDSSNGGSGKRKPGPVVPTERDMSGSVPPTREDHTKEETAVSSTRSVGSDRGGGELGLAGTVDEVLDILRSCPRFTIDDINTRIAVENAIGAVAPGADAIGAAREAVVWGMDPAYRKTHAAGVFLDALRKQPRLTLVGDRPRRGARHTTDDRVADLMAESERAAREEAGT